MLHLHHLRPPPLCYRSAFCVVGNAICCSLSVIRPYRDSMAWYCGSLRGCMCANVARNPEHPRRYCNLDKTYSSNNPHDAWPQSKTRDCQASAEGSRQQQSNSDSDSQHGPLPFGTRISPPPFLASAKCLSLSDLFLLARPRAGIVGQDRTPLAIAKVSPVSALALIVSRKEEERKKTWAPFFADWRVNHAVLARNGRKSQVKRRAHTGQSSIGRRCTAGVLEKGNRVCCMLAKRETLHVGGLRVVCPPCWPGLAGWGIRGLTVCGA